MKTIRIVSFLFAATYLTAATIGAVSKIISWVGMARFAEVVFNDPSILIMGYYDTCASLGFNYDFFATWGPCAVFALLILVLINSIT